DTEEGLRFTLLETVREYAAERLAQSGLQEAVQQRHAGFFRDLAATSASAEQLSGLDQAAQLRRLERDHDNFRTALAWARSAEADAFRAELGGPLRPFWKLAGYAEEASHWLEDLRPKADRLPPATRARLLESLAVLVGNRGDTGDSLALLHQS